MQNRQTHKRHLLSSSPELVIAAISFTAGICWDGINIFDRNQRLYAILFSLASLYIFFKLKHRNFCFIFFILLGLLFFLIGHHHARSHFDRPLSKEHIANQIKHQQSVSLYGILHEHPKVQKLPSDTKTKILMQVKSFYRRTGVNNEITELKTASGLVLLTLNGLAPAELNPGDHFVARTKVSPVKTFSTPGAFNYKTYLANRSIYLKGWIDSPVNIMKIQDFREENHPFALISLRYFPERIRHHMAVFIDTMLTQPARGLYKAILIGDRSDIPSKVLENFTKAGCIHILAISGMHMGLLGFMIIGLMTWLLKRSTWLLLRINVTKTAVSFALMPLLFYAFIAGCNIPVLRSLLMTAVFILAIISDRPGNIINHIAIAAFLILAWQPSAIQTASFQLSFVAVISIALIFPYLFSILLQKRNETQPDDRTKSDQISTLSKILVFSSTKLLNWFFAAIMITMAAMLGTFPLLLFHFNRFSLVSPITNLLVEPLVCFWSLTVGIIASLLIPIAPLLAGYLLKAGSYGLFFSEKICTFFSAMPFSSVRLPTPSVWEIAFYYFMVLSILFAFHLQGHGKRVSLILCMLSFFVLISSPVVFRIIGKQSGSTLVSVLDVGHGSAILLQLPGNKNILIDGGGAAGENFNIGERVIGPYLWKKKLKHLEGIVVSHPHEDHYNGLPFILKNFQPGVLWVNTGKGHDRSYTELLNLANKLNIPVEIPRTGEIMYQAGNTKLICVNNGASVDGASSVKGSTSVTIPPDANDMSLVLKLETVDSAFLFPADISANMADFLVALNRNLQADVLLAPHHGSRSSMSPHFIKAVAPEYIVISAGRHNPFNLSLRSFLKLTRDNTKILLTGRDGTLTFIEDGKQLNLSRYQIN